MARSRLFRGRCSAKHAGLSSAATVRGAAARSWFHFAFRIPPRGSCASREQRSRSGSIPKLTGSTWRRSTSAVRFGQISCLRNWLSPSSGTVTGYVSIITLRNRRICQLLSNSQYRNIVICSSTKSVSCWAAFLHRLSFLFVQSSVLTFEGEATIEENCLSLFSRCAIYTGSVLFTPFADAVEEMKQETEKKDPCAALSLERFLSASTGKKSYASKQRSNHASSTKICWNR